MEKSFQKSPRQLQRQHSPHRQQPGSFPGPHDLGQFLLDGLLMLSLLLILVRGAAEFSSAAKYNSAAKFNGAAKFNSAAKFNGAAEFSPPTKYPPQKRVLRQK